MGRDGSWTAPQSRCCWHHAHHALHNHDHTHLPNLPLPAWGFHHHNCSTHPQDRPEVPRNCPWGQHSRNDRRRLWIKAPPTPSPLRGWLRGRILRWLLVTPMGLSSSSHSGDAVDMHLYGSLPFLVSGPHSPPVFPGILSPINSLYLGPHHKVCFRGNPHETLPKTLASDSSRELVTIQIPGPTDPVGW